MALQYQLWGHTERPWGYEIRIDVQDSVSGEHYPLCMTWDMSWEEEDVPEEPVVAKEVERRIAMLVIGLAEPLGVPEPTYTEGEVVGLLVGKGYLQDGQALSDLPLKEAIADG